MVLYIYGSYVWIGFYFKIDSSKGYIVVGINSGYVGYVGYFVDGMF